MSDYEQKKQDISSQISELETTDAKTVPIEQVRTLVRAVKDLFEGRFETEEVELFGELGELAKYINNAKKELQKFAPDELKDNQLPEASDQLEAVVELTESSTQKIMDACEQIQAVESGLRERLLMADPPLDEDLMAAVDDSISEMDAHIVSIFEACNFQDITGQRIQKIVAVMKEVERQVLRMVIVFGLDKKKDNLKEEDKKEMTSDADLLNGPQLPGNSLEQEDIDELLAKLL